MYVDYILLPKLLPDAPHFPTNPIPCIFCFSLSKKKRKENVSKLKQNFNVIYSLMSHLTGKF